MHIRKANWDSNTFGYAVGTVNVPLHLSEMDLLHLLKDSSPFRVIYVTSVRRLTLPSLWDAGEKVHLALDLSVRLAAPRMTDVHTYSGGYTPELRELTYHSGRLSRFRADPRFVHKEFEQVYDSWMMQSLSGERAERVLVTGTPSMPTGVVTLERESAAVLHIGLLSTHPDHQRQGIGKQLVEAAIVYAGQAGYTTLSVATQAANLPAMGLYHAGGFSVRSREHVYHWWSA